MNKYSLSHSKWKGQYHIIFIPKYRRKVMYGNLKSDIRQIIIKLCKYKNVEIIEGAVCKDHVHLCVNIPLKERISDFIGYIKGRCTLQLFDKHPELRNKWNQEFWARGYYVSTVGELTEEAVKKYIENQEVEDKESDKNKKKKFAIPVHL